jgi:hypothetical protein
MQPTDRFRHLAAMFLACGCALTPSARGALTGQWDFLNGDLSATTGIDLAYLDGPGGATEAQTVFGTTTALSLPNPGGAPAHVMGFPKAPPTMGFILSPNMNPNGGGEFVNQYTLIFDLLYPESSSTGWRGLIQIDAPDNSNDADLHINPSGAIGISGQYHGAIQANTWHRVAAVFDLAHPAGPQLRKYIDGELVGEQTLGAGVDGRWALSPIGGFFGETALLFTDDNPDGGNTQAGYVSSIQVHDEALSSAYIAALGAPSGDQIPASIVVPAAITSRRPAPDAPNVLPGQSIQVILVPGSMPVDTASIQLELNDQALSPAVTTGDGGISIEAPLPSLPQLSQNTIQLTYTDPAQGGGVTMEWSFRMAPYGDNPDLTESLGEGQIAHWPLDDATDDPTTLEVVDVVSGNIGALTSPDPSTAWLGGTEARFGGALRVDGLNNSVIIPASPTLDINSDKVTLALWVKLDSLPADIAEGFGGIYDSTQDSYVLYLDRAANELRFKTTDANGHAARPGIAASALVTGQWLHVVAVYDGQASENAGEARIYLNGGLMDTHIGNDGGGGAGLTGAVRTGQVAGLGRDGSEARYFLGSAIDDVAVWGRALTTDEIGYLAAGKEVPPVTEEPDPLTIIAQPESQTALEGIGVQFSVTLSGGVPPFAYQWRRNGTDIPDASQSQLLVIAGPDTSGSYTVALTDARGTLESSAAVLTVTPLAADPEESLTQGLVALWPLDDGAADPGTTTVTDAAGSSDTTLSSPAPADAWLSGEAARFGGALHINGQDHYVNIPVGGAMDIATDQVSVAAWVKLTALPTALPEGFGGIFDSVQDNYVLYLDRGNAELRFKVTASNGNAARPGISESVLVTGEWIHVAGVYDGHATAEAGEARVYLNGERMDSHLGNDGSGGTGLSGVVRTGQAAAIGRNGTEPIYFLEADIDDVAVWSRALSETELDYLAAGNAVPRPAVVEAVELTAISVSGGNVVLTWTGGTGPFQVQWRPDLGSGVWQNTGSPTDLNTAIVAVTGATGFYRIQAAATP